MLFLFIIRRLNPRRRAIVGAVITVIRLVLIGVAAAVASVLMIHGIITTTVGIAFCIAAYIGYRNGQAAEAISAPVGGRPLVSG